MFVFRSPVALLPGFFFVPCPVRLCSGCPPVVRLAKRRFLLAKRRFLLLSSCYVENCSYLCIVIREREGNAGERPLMARLMRTTEFRACVTSVPRPFYFDKMLNSKNMTQFSNSTWSSDITVSGWMGQVLLKVFVVKDGIVWDTLYYVPCLGRTYDNCGSARKAISMFNKRGER